MDEYRINRSIGEYGWQAATGEPATHDAAPPRLTFATAEAAREWAAKHWPPGTLCLLVGPSDERAEFRTPRQNELF